MSKYHRCAKRLKWALLWSYDKRSHPLECHRSPCFLHCSKWNLPLDWKKKKCMLKPIEGHKEFYTGGSHLNFLIPAFQWIDNVPGRPYNCMHKLLGWAYAHLKSQIYFVPLQECHAANLVDFDPLQFKESLNFENKWLKSHDALVQGYASEKSTI